jgi:hypothetical protein
MKFPFKILTIFLMFSACNLINKDIENNYYKELNEKVSKKPPSFTEIMPDVLIRDEFIAEYYDKRQALMQDLNLSQFNVAVKVGDYEDNMNALENFDKENQHQTNTDEEDIKYIVEGTKALGGYFSSLGKATVKSVSSAKYAIKIQSLDKKYEAIYDGSSKEKQFAMDEFKTLIDNNYSEVDNYMTSIWHKLMEGNKITKEQIILVENDKKVIKYFQEYNDIIIDLFEEVLNVAYMVCKYNQAGIDINTNQFAEDLKSKFSNTDKEIEITFPLRFYSLKRKYKQLLQHNDFRKSEANKLYEDWNSAKKEQFFFLIEKNRQKVIDILSILNHVNSKESI